MESQGARTPILGSGNSGLKFLFILLIDLAIRSGSPHLALREMRKNQRSPLVRKQAAAVVVICQFRQCVLRLVRVKMEVPESFSIPGLSSAWSSERLFSGDQCARKLGL